MTPERKLWLAVANRAIEDAAKMIDARDKNQPHLWFDGDYHKLSRDERKRHRDYFESGNWKMVAALAGLDVDAEQIMRLVDNPREWRRRVKLAGTETMRYRHRK